MLWLSRVIRWILGLLIVYFVLLFREKNKYLAKNMYNVRKILAKINKKNEMIMKKIRRGKEDA